MYECLLLSYMVSICDVKNAHLHSSFFSFNAIHLKIFNNLEHTIP